MQGMGRRAVDDKQYKVVRGGGKRSEKEGEEGREGEGKGEGEADTML